MNERASFLERRAWLRSDGIRPSLGSLGPEGAKSASRYEVALQVEGVVVGGTDGQESLGRARRFEPLELPLASPDRRMRMLRAIVLSQSLLVPRTQADIPESRRVGSQLVRHNNGWRSPLLLEKHAHELPGRTCVSPRLHQDIEHIAFVIDDANFPTTPDSSVLRCCPIVGIG